MLSFNELAFTDAIMLEQQISIVQQQLAIMEDRERWIQKKSAQYYNSRYNEILYYGLEADEPVEREE